jgi:hypothetical protein
MSLHAVCGGTSMGNHWPWEARELDPWVPFIEITFPNHTKNWELLYLLPKRPVLYPGRGFNLFRTEVLQ